MDRKGQGGDWKLETGNWRSNAITSLEGHGKMICSGHSTKGTRASRSRTGGGGERAGVRGEEMVSRFLQTF
jgi:hypothetical protein